MKKSTIVLIIIAVLFVIGLVWAFNANRAVAPENGVVQNEEIDTSDWETYRNEDLGFEFKYPRNMTYLEKQATDFQKENAGLLFSLTVSDNTNLNILEISVFSKGNSLTLIEWITKHNPNPNTFESIKVDSYPAYRYTKNAMGNDVISYVVDVGKRVFIINSTPRNKNIVEIINSFKFI